MFSHLIGNTAIKTYLERMVARKSVAQSLLFAGPEGVGKGEFALSLAKSLLGSATHPDLHVYRPEGKTGMHSIQTLRQLSEEVYMAPYQGPWKVFIIHDAERMLPTSGNALLKTFEEPAPDAILVLLSSQPTALLPTILSRCRTLYFQALSQKEIQGYLQNVRKLGEDEAERIAFLAQGSLGQALRLLEEGSQQVRIELLDLLAKGKLRNYKELLETLEALCERVNSSKDHAEETLRVELSHKVQDSLTAVQKEGVQKEIDGVLALQQVHVAQHLFDLILGWYRDLQLLLVQGKRGLLLHPDYEAELEQALQRGEILPLEIVQKALADARLSLERSTSLNLCLETLFLRLQRV